ncbi:MAG: hypothetical protein ACE5NM_05075 [Sedimentisphaerales bacterium]
MAQLKTQNLKCRGKVLIRLLFAVLILAGILGLIFIWVVRALPHVAIAEISELTNAQIEVESVDFNFDGSVFIKKLVIRPDQTRDEGRETRDDAILKADTVYARFGLGSLLLLGPRLKEIHIRDFVFNAQYDLDTGQWNIAALKINVPKDGAGKLPLVHLEKGTLQYSKISKGRAKVLAAVPIDMRFRPAEEMLAGYSFDITTAERTNSGRSRLFGVWRPGRISIGGGISSMGISAFIPREAGTLEKAWVINVLDAELDYDRDNNYSLKLKIKDLLYTQETADDTFAFDKPAFLTKSGLFTTLQRFFSRYRPAGRFDIDLEASGNFNQLSESTVAGRVYCKDVSIRDRKFPYTIEQITGQVDFTGNSAVLNNLSGKHGDVKVTFNGWSKDFGPNQQYQIQITSDNMALDDALQDALSTKQKELWSAFSPSGLAAIDYHLSRRSQTDKKKTLIVELLGAEATYRDFPYLLKNLSGKLSLGRDSITVSDVVSQINGGKITFNGKVAQWDTDRPIYYLSIKAHDISFDSTLARKLLAKQSDFYSRFDMTGLVDAEVTIFTPTEKPGPTSFLADLALKRTSVKVNKLPLRSPSARKPLVISDVSAKVILTPDSTSIKSFTGRYDQSLVSLAGGIWHTDKEQPSRYHLSLNAEQIQLSDDLFGLLPTPVGKMISKWQPKGKINLSAHLNKAAGKDQLDYQITVDCLGDSVNFKQFAYPLRDITGRLTITNNKVKLQNITARPTDSVPVTMAPSVIKVNGQIALADNTFSQGQFELSASDISFSEYLGDALPEGIAPSYQALSPTGRFDLNLEDVKIFKADDGEKYIDFTGTAKFKACHFNISGTRAELKAVLKTKGSYKIGSGFSDGQISLIAENLEIKGKSITSLTADVNYNRHLQSWEASNLIADCYGGRLAGKLQVTPADEGAWEYLLQVGFDNIDLRRFLAAPAKAEAESSQTSHTSGTMSGSLSIGARIAPMSSVEDRNGGSRIGRCRLAIRDMQVGKLSPLAQLLYTGYSILDARSSILEAGKVKKSRIQNPESRIQHAFEQMIIDSYIKGDRLFFEKFDLSGETAAFYGSGLMDLQSGNVDLTLIARGERLATAEPSIIQSLTEGLGGAVVRIEVTGNVHNPKVETKTLPVIEDSLKILGTTR